MREKIKCFLISGKKGVGKTTMIRNFVENILTKKEGFKIDENNIWKVTEKRTKTITKQIWEQNIKIGKYFDYFCKFEDIKNIIVISTASDTIKLIENFKSYFEKIKYENKDISIIAPIRNPGDENRDYFINVIGKIAPDLHFEQDVIEIPLSKINEQNDKYQKIKEMYTQTIFSLVKDIINNFIFGESLANKGYNQ